MRCVRALRVCGACNEASAFRVRSRVPCWRRACLCSSSSLAVVVGVVVLVVVVVLLLLLLLLLLLR